MRLSHLVVAASAAAALAVSVSAGCGSDSDGEGAGASGSTSGDATCAPGSACTDVQSDCLALVDNTGSDKPGLRISYLDVIKPAALSSPFVLDLIGDGVLLNKTECYLDGKGTFTWLLEFDKAAGQLRTGGAPPSTPEEGYCFLSGELGGQTVDPIVADVSIDGGSFEFPEGSDVVVPIYLDEAGTSYVLLPLKKARIYEATLSEDQNCIGQHNTAGLKTVDQCFPTLDNPAFISGAKLDGFITLEDADTVVIKELGSTLCTILAGDDDGGDPRKCIRDAGGAIAFKGDWCSTTNTADGCQDAVALGAEFAASAVKINGSCN